MAPEPNNVTNITLRQAYLQSTFLIRAATSQSNNSPIVLTSLGVPHYGTYKKRMS